MCVCRCGHLFCLHLLAFQNKLLNTRVHKYFFYTLLLVILEVYSEVQLLGNSLFTMLKNYNRIFYSRYTILHSHQNWLKCSNFFTALSMLVFFFYFWKKKYKLLLKGEMWYLIVVLTWISLIISDVEGIFLCLLAICINIYKYLFKLFPQFKMFFCCHLASIVLHIFLI